MTKQEEKTDYEYLKTCLANAVFYDYDKIESTKLLELFKHKFIVFEEFNHPQYGISAKNQRRADEYSKASLGELRDDGYITMELVDGVYISRPTQKLFDADELPIGFKHTREEDEDLK